MAPGAPEPGERREPSRGSASAPQASACRRLMRAMGGNLAESNEKRLATRTGCEPVIVARYIGVRGSLEAGAAIEPAAAAQAATQAAAESAAAQATAAQATAAQAA